MSKSCRYLFRLKWLTFWLGLIILQSARGATAQFDWAKGLGDGGNDEGLAIVADAEGNAYVAGYFQGTLAFGTNTLITPPSTSSAFVVKLDSSGNPLWAWQAHSSWWSSATRIAVDTNGICYVVGWFRGQTGFGGLSLEGSTDANSYFLLKLGETGQAAWVRQVGTSTSQEPVLAVDVQGNSYVSGAGIGPLPLQQTNIPLNNIRFVAKYNSSGTPVWAYNFGGVTGESSVRGMAALPDGSLTLAGLFYGGLVFGSTNFTSAGGSDVFLFKLSGSTGSLQWARRAGGFGTEYALALTCDAFGNSYIGGAFSGNFAIGETNLNSASERGFVAKFGMNGELISVFPIDMVGVRGIAVDGDSNVAVADYGLQKYNSQGVIQWEVPGGYGLAAAVDAGGNFFETGWHGSYSVPGLESNGGRDVFILKRGRRPPSILQQPATTTVLAGRPLVLSVDVASQSTATYQWFKDGQILSGETNRVFNRPTSTPADGGAYSFTVANTDGEALSETANVNIKRLGVIVNGSLVSTNLLQLPGGCYVELETGPVRGVILYTLDGTEPTIESSIYDGPFWLSNSVTFRLLGYSSDFSEEFTEGPVVLDIAPLFRLTAFSPGGGLLYTSDGPMTNLGQTVIQGDFPSNSVYTITAVPYSNWVFLHWSGDAAGANSTTSIRVNKGKTVKAVFGTALSKTPPSHGSLLCTPNQSFYPYGSQVLLTAMPNLGYQFALWGGIASGRTNPMTIQITNASPSVSALFVPRSPETWVLNTLVTDGGTIVRSPELNSYPLTQAVTIKALPNAGFEFAGWTGDASGNNSELQIVGNAPSTTIVGIFTNRIRIHIELQKSGLSLSIPNSRPGESFQFHSSNDLETWDPVGEISFDQTFIPPFSRQHQSNMFFRAVLR